MALCSRTDDGNWHDTNWDTVPGPGDDVDLAGYDVVLDADDVTVNSITSSSSGATLTIDGKELTVTNDVDCGDNLAISILAGSLICGTLSVSPTSNPMVNLAGGSLTVGTINSGSGSIYAVTQTGGQFTCTGGGGPGPLLTISGGMASVGGTASLLNCGVPCIYITGGTVTFDDFRVSELNNKVVAQSAGTATGTITCIDSSFGSYNIYDLYNAGAVSNLAIHNLYVGAAAMAHAVRISESAIATGLALYGQQDFSAYSLLEYDSTAQSTVAIYGSADVQATMIWFRNGALTIAGEVVLEALSCLCYRMAAAGAVTLQARITMRPTSFIILDETLGSVYYDPPDMPSVLRIQSDAGYVVLEEPDYPAAGNIRAGVTARHGTITGTMAGGGGIRTHLEHVFG